MTAPIIHPYPIKRPGFLSNARFEGNDENLRFYVDYPDSGGVLQSIGFRLFDDGSDYQEMCIPVASYDINRIPDTCLIAHLRMASIVSDTVPTSKEWQDAMQVESGGQTKHFQTAVGQVKMSNFTPHASGETVDIELQRGTTTNKKTISVDYDEVCKEGYVFAPSTQLLVIPGSVLKEFPTNYKHDYPNGDILTQAERDAIIAYVNGLAVWV